MSAPPSRAGAVARHPLTRTVVFVGLAYAGVRWLLPPFGGWIASDDWFAIRPNLESSGREVPLYLLLAVLAWFCHLSYSEDRWQAFQAPIWRFLRWHHPLRLVVLAVLPFAVGGLVFLRGARGGAEPVSNPIRHPTPPDRFSTLRNPYRTPTPEMLAAFDKWLQSGVFNPELSTEPEVVAYAEVLAAGAPVPGQREAAFHRRTIEEGRELYMINCRPCHGTKAMGDGPMSPALRRQPADFTGVETIATLVEGAVFWRVKKGGIKLPREGAPWESAMPRWETDLTDEQIWKIIMAEYDIAGNAPREPERSETGAAEAGEGGAS